MELKTARLTVLIDPSTKDAFEIACRQIDMTPSQVVRRLVREFMQETGESKPRRRNTAAKSKRR